MIAEGSFGRPEDKDIQKEFMKKIRGDKLQAINAECELEICLAFNYGHKKQKSKNKRSKKKQVEQDTQILQNLMMTIPIGSLDADRREKLQQKFKILKQSWKFQQIAENQPLPDYFFQDGCDLSYILYQLQKLGPQFQEFSAEDLIFLQLLCLEGRKLLNKETISYFEYNMEFMIPAMKSGLEKIKQKLKQHREKGGQKTKERKISNEDGDGDNQNSSDVAQASNEKPERKGSQKKTKKIEKKQVQKKNKKKNQKKKGEESSQSANQEQENESEEIKDEKRQLALKTCNYISWAYWYIIKK